MIKCFSFNARSIVNKLAELTAFISTYDPDCVGISESWLNGYRAYAEFIAC